MRERERERERRQTNRNGGRKGDEQTKKERETDELKWRERLTDIHGKRHDRHRWRRTQTD